MMAAGAYGFPQFLMRVFMWGALPGEKLPQYPLQTHNVVVRGFIPTEFELNTIAYDEGHVAKLKKELFLGDALSDLPLVQNNEKSGMTWNMLRDLGQSSSSLQSFGEMFAWNSFA